MAGISTSFILKIIDFWRGPEQVPDYVAEWKRAVATLRWLDGLEEEVLG